MELSLLLLPLALGQRFSTGVVSPLLPQLKLLDGISQTNKPLHSITLRTIPTALALTALVHGVYADGLVEWFVSEFCRYLSRPTEPELRSLTWSLFPLVCFGAHRAGKDAFALAGKQFSITVADSPQLLSIAARSLGAMSCARSGCLMLEGFPAEPVDMDMDDSEDASAVSLSVVSSIRLCLSPGADVAIMGIYRCRDCDHTGFDQEQRQPVAAADAQVSVSGSDMDVCREDETGTVSLSGLEPYWFLALNRELDTTPAEFLRSVSRFIQHAPVGDIDLRTSAIGVGIISHLLNSSTGIRLAAKDAILSYSRGRVSDGNPQFSAVRRSNRSETMHELVKLSRSSQDPRVIKETLPLVAGGIGCACEPQEQTLGQVVPFLVGHYCHSTSLQEVSGEQLHLISQTHAVPLEKLLWTFSPEIACTLAGALVQSLAQSLAMLLSTVSSDITSTSATTSA
ncbi:hypothetical protein FBU59_004049, partial [Linderina macrospora]